MKIIVATSQRPFFSDGRSHQARELAAALGRAGHQAEIVAIPFQSDTPHRVTSQMLACRLLDGGDGADFGADLLIGLDFPGYLLPHPRKVLWIGELYSDAYELWDHPLGRLRDSPEGVQVRQMVLQADRNLLTEVQAAFTTSAAVSAQFAAQLGVTLPPLYHPPPGAAQLHKGKARDYLLFPGPLSPRKRPRLVLEALALTREPVIVRFAGAFSDPDLQQELKSLVADRHLERRVQWLGELSREELCGQYASSLAILFPPVQAGYGYAALEAMLSSKAIVTCTDAGGLLDFVVAGETGLVAGPTVDSLALALDAIWSDRPRAQRLGEAGHAHLSRFNLSWENVIRQLCD